MGDFFITIMEAFLNTQLETKNNQSVPSPEVNKSSPTELKNDTDLVLQHLGPRRDALYIIIPITVIYLAIFLTGVIGNISTCIVIARNKSMHTATNYYLFSLAISDLLLLVSGLPPEIYLVWRKYPYVFGEIFCVLRGLAAETSTNATVLTITAFTVERYVAICHPFLSHTMSKLSRAIKLILIIWLVALSFSIPQALQFGIVVHPEKSTDFVMCTYKKTIIEHSFELSTFLFFLVPMTLITILYALIGLKLRKSNMMKRETKKSNGSRKLTSSTQKDRNCRHHTGRSSRRVLKMLVAVVVAFFICWAPFHVQRLIAIYGTSTKDHISSNGPGMEFLYLLFTYISGVLYYVSTSINPILYNIMSNKFREAFMETLARCCRFPGFQGRRKQRCYSSLTRSQQRPPGLFGCGTRGMAAAQDSTDCSGNSVRDDSFHQSSSAGHRRVSRNPSSESTQPVPTGKWSSSRRTVATEMGTSDTSISISSSNRLAPRGRGARSFRASNGRTTVQRLNDENAIPWRNSHDLRNQISTKVSRAGSKRNSYETGSRNRWWRFFDWVSRSKPSETDKRVSYSPPGRVENVVIDADGNHEEYSMTACNISNSSLRDVDERAIEDELSAYMDEVHMRELRAELKSPDNG